MELAPIGNAPSGSGTVTVVSSGNLNNHGVVTGGGGQTAQTEVTIPSATYPQPLTQVAGAAPAYMPPFISGNAILFSNAKPIPVYLITASANTQTPFVYNNGTNFTTQYQVPSGRQLCASGIIISNANGSPATAWISTSANSSGTAPALVYQIASVLNSAVAAHGLSYCWAAGQYPFAQATQTGVSISFPAWEMDAPGSTPGSPYGTALMNSLFSLDAYDEAYRCMLRNH